MSELTNVQKSPFVKYPDEMLLFQIGKTEWQLVIKKKKIPQKRSFLDRIIGFNPNEPIKRTSFFDIVAEEEEYFHCVIGFRDKISGEFTYTRVRKGKGCIIHNGLVLISMNALLEGQNPSQEEALITDIAEESAIPNGAKILLEDRLSQGELKYKYKISLTRNRQLVVNGYHYAFIASSYVVLHHFDGYDDFIESDGIDFDSGGIF